MQKIMKYAYIFISFQFIFENPKKEKQRDIFTEVITWVSLFQRCDYTMHFTIQGNDANGLPEVHFEDLVQLQIGVMRGCYQCLFVEVSKNVDKNDLIWLVRRRFHREQNRVFWVFLCAQWMITPTPLWSLETRTMLSWLEIFWMANSLKAKRLSLGVIKTASESISGI